MVGRPNYVLLSFRLHSPDSNNDNQGPKGKEKGMSLIIIAATCLPLFHILTWMHLTKEWREKHSSWRGRTREWRGKIIPSGLEQESVWVALSSVQGFNLLILSDTPFRFSLAQKKDRKAPQGLIGATFCMHAVTSAVTTSRAHKSIKEEGKRVQRVVRIRVRNKEDQMHQSAYVVWSWIGVNLAVSTHEIQQLERAFDGVITVLLQCCAFSLVCFWESKQPGENYNGFVKARGCRSGWCSNMNSKLQHCN